MSTSKDDAPKKIERCVVQVTNIATNVTEEMITALFGILGKIDEVILYPNKVTPYVPSKVGYIKFRYEDTAESALHLSNTVFVDKALIIGLTADGKIPRETEAMKIGAPSNCNAALQPKTSDWPPDVISMITGMPPDQFISTIEPRLASQNLPLYPVVPSTTDVGLIEDIRRTIYASNIDIKVPAESLLAFFSQVGEVAFVRMATPAIAAAAAEDPNATRGAYVEFSRQPSVAMALAYNGVMFAGRPIRITHSMTAIQKPKLVLPGDEQREIDEAMRKVKEANNLICAAIDVSGMMLPVSAAKAAERADKAAERRSRGDRSRSRSPRAKRSRRSRSRSGGRRASRSSRSSRHRRSSRSRSRDRRRGRRSRSRDKRRSRSKDRKRSSRSRSRDRRSGRRRRSSRSKSRDRSRRHKDKDSKPAVRDYDEEEKLNEDNPEFATFPTKPDDNDVIALDGEETPAAEGAAAAPGTAVPDDDDSSDDDAAPKPKKKVDSDDSSDDEPTKKADKKPDDDSSSDEDEAQKKADKDDSSDDGKPADSQANGGDDVHMEIVDSETKGDADPDRIEAGDGDASLKEAQPSKPDSLVNGHEGATDVADA